MREAPCLGGLTRLACTLHLTQDEREEAGRMECRWKRAQLAPAIRDLVLDDQRLRNDLCWFVFDC